MASHEELWLPRQARVRHSQPWLDLALHLPPRGAIAAHAQGMAGQGRPWPPNFQPWLAMAMERGIGWGAQSNTAAVYALDRRIRHAMRPFSKADAARSVERVGSDVRVARSIAEEERDVRGRRTQRQRALGQKGTSRCEVRIE